MITILKSALIITMNQERKIWNQASLVIENERIAAIDTDEVIEKSFRADKVIDCQGKVLLPGFVNLHTHQTLSIIRGVAEDMGTAPAYTKSVPQGYQLSEEESNTMALLGAAEALKFGSTYILDMYTNCSVNAKAFATLGMRANVCEMVHNMDFSTLYKREYQVDEKLGEELLNRNIALLEHWNNHPLIDTCVGLHAPDTCSTSFIRKILDVKEKYHVKIATHLAQSIEEVEQIKQISNGLSSVEFYKENGVLSKDLIAAHCIYVNEQDIELLKNNQVNIAHIPEGNAKGGMAAPLKAFLDKNINVTLGTDNGSADMIETMRMGLCISRILTEGFSVMPMEMLEMATINGARAIGRDKDLGSLEKGKLADVLILDFRKPHLVPCLNPVGTILHTGLGSDIQMVFVNGEMVVQNGKLLKVNEEELLKEAQQIAERRWLAVNHDLNSYYFLKL